MYLTRWRAVADGSKLLRPLEGLSDVSTRWVVTHTERAQYKQCAPVPAKGRHRPTTSDLLRPISYRRTDKDEKETSEMIIMEAILSASAPLHGIAAQSVGRWAVRTFKRWRGPTRLGTGSGERWVSFCRGATATSGISASTVVKSCARVAATHRASALPCRTQCLRSRISRYGQRRVT
jgi:hypothetical protein